MRLSSELGVLIPEPETVVRSIDVVMSELAVVMPEPETVVRSIDVVMSELGVVMPEPETVVRIIYAAVGKPCFPTLSQTLKCGVP